MTPVRHALVLTAGLGTRLRPLTLVRAKPALPVAGVPLVRRIVRWLVANGADELVLNLHHLPATLARVVGDGADLDARVRYSWEQPTVLGSAGGPRQALDVIGAERFLIVNGDTLTDVDLTALADAHASSGALVTLALVPNHEPLKYGGVRLDEKARVVGFVRAGASAAGSYHFVGVQAVEARAFHSVPPGRAVNSIGDVYDQLVAAAPGALHGFVSGASFADIGTLADYWRTSHAIARAEGVSVSGPTADRDVHPGARVHDCILWDDVRVAAGAELDECIVTDGVSVPEGVAHRRAVLVAAGETYATHPMDRPD